LGVTDVVDHPHAELAIAVDQQQQLPVVPEVVSMPPAARGARSS
jgi:hypothetical protein